MKHKLSFTLLLVALTSVLRFYGGGTGVHAQPLDSLRAELRRENPELRAMQLEYEAALRVGESQTQLPDLEIGAGVFVLPIETRTGPQQFRVGATQMLPWPGKLAAMAAVADARARPLLEHLADRQLELFYRLDRAYYTLAGLRGRAAVLRESLDLYAGLDRLALRRVEAGAGSSVDVYRIQLQRRGVERRLAEIDNLSRREVLTINRLLARPPDARIEPELDPAVRVAEILDFAPDLAADDPDLTGHPALRFYELQAEAGRAALELNELDRRPDFGVGLDYIATGRRTDLSPPGNGRDVILPRATVRIPLSRRRYRAKRQEESLRIEAFSARRASTEDAFRAELHRALLAIDDAANELLFLDEQARITEATLAVARTEYANNRRPFDELLRLENQLIDYRTLAVKSRTTILLEGAVIDRYLLNNQK